jgi:hypothetical protein
VSILPIIAGQRRSQALSLLANTEANH